MPDVVVAALLVPVNPESVSEVKSMEATDVAPPVTALEKSGVGADDVSVDESMAVDAGVAAVAAPVVPLE